MSPGDTLFDVTPLSQPVAESAAVAAPVPVEQLKLRPVDRAQMHMLTLDLDTLVSGDHKVRGIWDLTGHLDLSRFYEGIRSQRGQAGREHEDPRLLLAIWLYAYSEGISSAREVARMMEYEPALRWLSGLVVLSHETLSQFRKGYGAELEGMFTNLLAVLEGAGLVDLDRVMHDGTKIQAQASANSFRREKTLRERLEQAGAVVQQLGDPDQEEPTSKQEARRRRAARERWEQLERASTELQQIQAEKSGAEEKEKARVSLTEPEARMMKHGNDGGIAPSYNLQLTTDAQQKVIVRTELTQSSSDGEVTLSEVAADLKQSLGRPPEQMVADGGFTNQKNIVGLAQEGVDFIGSLPDPQQRQRAASQAAGIGPEFAASQFHILSEDQVLLCPAGQRLPYRRTCWKNGNQYAVYQARGSDCQVCPYLARCCKAGNREGRTVWRLIAEPAAVVAFRAKMDTAEARAIYRQRSEVAEFPNLWIKEKLGLRKFRLRGLYKAGIEALWACLTYNAMQWIRLAWSPAAPVA